MARIMLADDHSSVRFLVSSLVTRAGHEVVYEARNGIEAMEGYFIVQPDLLILDINMPMMDGISVLNEIRKKDPNAKIMLCSGHINNSVRDHIRGWGIMVVPKPFDVVEFISTVNYALVN